MNEATRCVELDDLEPVELGQASDLTDGFALGAFGDDNVVWGEFL